MLIKTVAWFIGERPDPPERPQLRVIEGGRSEGAAGLSPRLLVLAHPAAAAAVLGAELAVCGALGWLVWRAARLAPATVLEDRVTMYDTEAPGAIVQPPPSWREETRRDRLVRAQIDRDRETARIQARIAERDATARARQAAANARRATARRRAPTGPRAAPRWSRGPPGM